MLITIIKKLYRIYRRKFYLQFRKQYVADSIAKRRGMCLGCGCCSTCLPPCIHYDYSTKECKLWKAGKFSEMSIGCQSYPFDEKDKVEFSQKYCGFYWDKLSDIPEKPEWEGENN